MRQKENEVAVDHSTFETAAHVLLIDDDPAVLDSMGMLLEEAGFYVLRAKDGVEGLHFLSHNPVEAIVCDIIMPGMDGTEFLEKARERCNDVSIILITGEPTTETALEALRSQAFDYLPKPLDPERFIRTVTNGIEAARVKSENRILNDRLQQRAAALEVLVRERTLELARLSSELIEIQDAERRRMARELHDSVGQSLLSLRMEMQALKDDFAGNESLVIRLQGLLDRLTSTTDEIRRISHAMNPVELSELGLGPAIHALSESLNAVSDIDIVCFAEHTGRGVGAEQSLHVYRVAQECLSNAVRHSSARNISVMYRETEDTGHLSVSDDGSGMSEDSRNRGIGLLILRERAALASGRLEIISSPASGTRIELQFAKMADVPRRGAIHG